jgi:hypothetical protein
MSQQTLEKRVEALEREVAELRTALEKVSQPYDWRSTVGMFSGNEAMKAIDAAGQAIREKERQRAQSRKTKARRVKK